MCLNLKASKRQDIISRCPKKIKGKSISKEGSISGKKEKDEKKIPQRFRFTKKAA